MRLLLALIVGIAIGAAGLWYYHTSKGHARIQNAGDQVQSAAKSAGDTLHQKIGELNLSPQSIKDELARTGRVVRDKAQQAGRAFNDATADTRITAAIKTKLVANRDLPGMSISVNTTAGVVTLSGAVDSADQIGKAMVVAMETEGVHQVISTLQVKQPKN